MLNMGKDQHMLHSETSYDINFFDDYKKWFGARVPQGYHIVSSYFYSNQMNRNFEFNLPNYSLPGSVVLTINPSYTRKFFIKIQLLKVH